MIKAIFTRCYERQDCADRSHGSHETGRSRLSAMLIGLLASCLWLGTPLRAELASIQPDQVHGRTALDLVTQLERAHLRPRKLDDEMSSLMYDRYLEALDPSRVFFLQADLDRFEKYRFLLDDFILDEDTSPAFDIFNQLLSRQRSRFEWLITYLDQQWDELDFTRDEDMQLDRSQTPWALSDQALNEVWRKRLKATIIDGKLNAEADEEIRNRLMRRYRNSLERLERYKAQDVFTLFVNAYASSLDPHTTYLSPPVFENFNIVMSQSLEGIGAVLEENEGHVRIQRVLPGSPASKSGKLVPNSSILAVGQGREGALIDVVGWRIDDVVKLIRGPRDSIVRLKVRQPHITGQTEPFELSIVRNRIQLEEQAASSQIIEFEHADRIRRMGVIRIASFYADYVHDRTSSSDVRRLLAELGAEGVEGVVIDLRNNGGGLLQEANSLAGLFIDEGPVVQVRQHDQRPFIHLDRVRGQAWDGPLAVLVNRLSASASEIFAAAIQDYGRGPVIGERTFGKGTIQELVPLEHGQIKLTQGKFYRISGMSTQHAGVTPDILYPQSIDPQEVGESARETAIPNDAIDRARYSRSRQVEALSGILRDNHQRRIAKDADFLYVQEINELAQELRKRTHVSLNLDSRERDKAAIDTRRLEIENRLRLARGKSALASLDAAASEDLSAGVAGENSGTAASSAASVQPAEDAPDEPEDPFVTEAMRILVDYAHLSSQLLAASKRQDS